MVLLHTLISYYCSDYGLGEGAVESLAPHKYWVWWHKSVTPDLGRSRQEDEKLKVILNQPRLRKVLSQKKKCLLMLLSLHWLCSVVLKSLPT